MIELEDEFREAVRVEAIAARKKFPDPMYALHALQEEVGELTRAALRFGVEGEGTGRAVYDEVIQVGAMLQRLWTEGDPNIKLPPVSSLQFDTEVVKEPVRSEYMQGVVCELNELDDTGWWTVHNARGQPGEVLFRQTITDIKILVVVAELPVEEKQAAYSILSLKYAVLSQGKKTL